MEQNSSPREAVEQLAEEFVTRYRRGERPSITEYCARLPDHEAEIRDLFPALVLMENVAPAETGGELFGLPTAKTDHEHLPHPERLGDYRIIREVGRGGMGIVYEAEQVSLGRHVALKVLPHRVSKDAKSLERFRREARAAAKLHHTNIVPVFEVGKVDEVRFYAMQYIPGQSLDHVLEELRRLRDEGLMIKHPEGRAAADVDSNGDGDPVQGNSVHEANKSATIARALASGQLTSRTIPEMTDLANKRMESSGIEPQVDVLASFDPVLGRRGQESTEGIGFHPGDGSARQPVSFPGYSDLSGSSGMHLLRYYQSVARIGIQVAQALGYAHDRGVVHRDIKPSNLLLDIAGTVWVTDFGLAKEVDEGLTQTGDIIGTLRYMAPERFRGGGNLRSDLYSLGVTLYELVTLRPAFQESDHLRLIERITSADPTHPRSIDKRIPADLETVILKAIDKDPERRYQCGQQLADDLQCFLECRPIKARRVGWTEHTWRWCRRNPIVATLLTVTSMLLATIAVVSSIHADRLRGQLELTRRAEDKERDERRERELALFNAYLQQAKAERSSHRTGQRFQTLAAVRNALKLGEKLEITRQQRLALRNEAIAGLVLPDVRIVREWPGWPKGTRTIAFDGTQRRYARLSQGGEISVRQVEGDREVARFGAMSNEAFLNFSHDGKHLSAWFPTRHRLILWHLESSPARVLIDTQTLPSFSRPKSDFSPDGTLFAFVNSKGEVNILNLRSGARFTKLNSVTNAEAIAFHPSKRQLAVVRGQNPIRIFNIDSAEVLAEPAHQGAIDFLVWNHDGRILATVIDNKTVQLWNVAERRSINSLVEIRQGGKTLDFNPSGDLLLSHDWSNAIRLWDAQHAVQIFQMHGDTHQMRFHTERDQFSTFDSESGAVQLREIASGREYRTLLRSATLGPGFYQEPAVSPNGRLLVVGMNDGVAFWDFETGDPLDFIRTGKNERIVFDGGGALLTNSSGGVLRWTFETSDDSPDHMRLSIPEQLPLPGYNTIISCSFDGRVIAIPQGYGAAVLHRGNPNRLVTIMDHFDARAVAVSPDGRWLATGAWFSPGVKVWDAATGKFQRELVPDEFQNDVGFSPDGRLLITNGRGCKLWNVGDWTEATQIGGKSFAFSRDGRLLAVRTYLNSGAIRLLDPTTGREFARLEDPNQDVVERIAFSPDCRKLLATGKGHSESVHVWDLQAIRNQLAEMKLDWDLPAYSVDEMPVDGRNVEASSRELTEWGLPGRSQARRLTLAVDHAAIARVLREPPPQPVDSYNRGLECVARHEWADAVTEYEAALRQFPRLAISWNAFAWLRTVPIRDFGTRRAPSNCPKRLWLWNRRLPIFGILSGSPSIVTANGERPSKLSRKRKKWRPTAGSGTTVSSLPWRTGNWENGKPAVHGSHGQLSGLRRIGNRTLISQFTPRNWSAFEWKPRNY